MSKLGIWLKRAFAATPIDRELYPPLELPIAFRVYAEQDFDQVREIYNRLAPGRFPIGSESAFVAHLQKGDGGILVGESNGKLVCCAGLEQMGPGIYMLCYGLVHPDYHKSRIGSTMTLLRIAATANTSDVCFLAIAAVDTSISFYRRFGFVEVGEWIATDDKEYPIAALTYHNSLACRIAETMKERKLVIAGGFRPSTSSTLRAEWVVEDGFRYIKYTSLDGKVENAVI